MPAPPFSDITLGPVTLHLYGLILGIAIVVAVQLLDRTMAWQNLDRARLSAIAIPAVVAGLVGARLYHVASKPLFYADHPLDALEIWHGGLGIYGGVALGTAVGIWRARNLNVPVVPLMDAAAPCIVIAQAIGRWGNYVNQELFGRPSDLPWALHVDRTFRPESSLDVATYHPTFLYESLWCFAVGAALLVAIRRWHDRPGGIVFAGYVALYSLERLLVEHLRVDPAHTFAGFRQNEWVALAILAAASVVAVTLMRRHVPETA